MRSCAWWLGLCLLPPTGAAGGVHSFGRPTFRTFAWGDAAWLVRERTGSRGITLCDDIVAHASGVVVPSHAPPDQVIVGLQQPCAALRKLDVRDMHVFLCREGAVLRSMWDPRATLTPDIKRQTFEHLHRWYQRSHRVRLTSRLRNSTDSAAWEQASLV